MAGTLIIVADRGRARFFRVTPEQGRLTALGDLVNYSLWQHARELAGDRQGRGMSRFHTSRVGLGDDSFYKRRSAGRFARLVAGAAFARGALDKVDRLCVMADPELMGLLRPYLAAHRPRMRILETVKNLTHAGQEEISSHLPREVWRRHGHA
jgi:protein required for attachment to host cells